MPGLLVWGGLVLRAGAFLVEWALVVVTFTDFGATGPYLGQLRLALARHAPGLPVADLLSDAPAFNPRASAYLLAALVPDFPVGTVCLAVVDPGVGTEERRPVVVRAHGRWFVGPDNGLFQVVARDAQDRDRWEILWRPERLSASFHGRDLFAPVAARVALGDWPSVRPIGWRASDFEGWPEDLAEVVYVDVYGNGMTGIRAARVATDARLIAAGRVLARARTFGAVAEGTAFWYENSIGLVEVAVSLGNAARALGLTVGTPVRVVQ